MLYFQVTLINLFLQGGHCPPLSQVIVYALSDNARPTTVPALPFFFHYNSSSNIPLQILLGQNKAFSVQMLFVR